MYTRWLVVFLGLVFSSSANATMQDVQLQESWAFGGAYSSGSPNFVRQSRWCEDPGPAGSRQYSGLARKCVSFSDAAVLWGIEWSSTASLGGHEILVSLVKEQSGPVFTWIFPVHHVRRYNGSSVVSSLDLPYGMSIAPGERIFLFVDAVDLNWESTTDVISFDVILTVDTNATLTYY